MKDILGRLASALSLKGAPAPDALRRQGQDRSQEDSGTSLPRPHLWKGLLGWALVCLFIWEVAGRLLIIPLCAPQWQAVLPPSVLDQIMTLLPGMLETGW
ncbi:MAG: hypothetical protein PUB01_06980 [Desulfovibrionaceae bacterium]|nr:hypothetical protein [Desulfovibrionaceae bacterium]